MILSPCCRIVKGYCNSCIYDLQKNNIYKFSNTLLSIFSSNGEKDEIIFANSPTADDNNQSKFIEDMKAEDLCFEIDDSNDFQSINTKISYTPQFCANCIIDRDAKSSYSLKRCEELIAPLLCEAICFRYFDPLSLDTLLSNLSFFKESTCRSIEINFTPKQVVSIDDCLKLKEQNERIFKIILFSQANNQIITIGTDLTIQYSKENLIDEFQCGFVSDFYMNAQTQFYIESKNHNNCLYKKIAIDRKGKIKNCPAMNEEFGTIDKECEDLRSIVQTHSFQKYWSISKDQIEVCCDCEYRYACHDCRCFLKDKSNIKSKPLKCNYNPYEES